MTDTTTEQAFSEITLDHLRAFAADALTLQKALADEKREPVRKLAIAIAKAAPPTTIQSLIFDREVFDSSAAAVKWSLDHDFTADKVDETATSYRVRQRSPADFVRSSFRTINIDEGVTAAIGRLRPELVTKRDTEVHRERTAIKRSELSKPIKRLLDDGLLAKGDSVFDYGSGKGDDVRLLRAKGFAADGFDPAHDPGAKKRADVVNLGFVVNVIENAAERKRVVKEAFGLARKLLVVAARVDADKPAGLGKPHRDGVLTDGGTFQKFYKAGELAALVSSATGRDAVEAASGVVYAFKSKALREQVAKASTRKRSREYLERALKLARASLPGWAYAALVRGARSHAGGTIRARMRAEEKLAIEKASTASMSGAELKAARARLRQLTGSLKRKRGGSGRVEALLGRVEREMVKRKLLKADEVAKGFVTGTPDGGAHAHGLARSSRKTSRDGAHRHAFAMPGTGQPLVTDTDGSHEHALTAPNALQTAADGGHSHHLALPDGRVVETDIDGPHEHRLMVETSTLGGQHQHTIRLPDGASMKSLTVANWIALNGVPATTVVHEAALLTQAAAEALLPPEPELPTPDQAVAMMAKGDDVAPSFDAVAEVTAADGDPISVRFGGDGRARAATLGKAVELAEGDLVAVTVGSSAGMVITNHSDATEPTAADAVDELLVTAAEIAKVAALDFVGPEVAPVVFVAHQPSGLEVAREQALVGPDGATFADAYLVPLRLTKADVAVGFAVPSLAGADADWGARLDGQLARWPEARVVALGTEARRLLGDRSDVCVPHPGAIRKRGDRGEVGRKMRALRKALDNRGPDDQDPPTSDKRPIPRDGTAGILADDTTGGSRGERSVSVSIAKSLDEKQIVYGVVLDPYRVDLQGDWIPPADIESTAHDFTENSRLIGFEHVSKADAVLVESSVEPYPTPGDYTAAMNNQPHKVTRRKFGSDFVTSGSWLAAVRLGDGLWKMHKAGQLNAFSIGGFSFKTKITTAAMPDVEFVDLEPAR